MSQGKKKEGGEAVPDVAKGDWVCMSKRCTEVINFRKDTKCSKCGAVKRMNQASYKAPKDEAPVKAHKFIFL
ncbi:hypothetical protein T484DRAFT_1803882 [Baffinella frigidus]|nr:hypothetical protein T484DRAFT_1803882 [Cryptophyta sp. CCMP2293]